MIGLAQPNLVIDQLSLGFNSPCEKAELKVLENITLEARDGEFISIVGPSGCGKTTLLNVIAGFEHAQEGEVHYNGETIRKPSPERAVVFQSAVLFPWLTVQGNIAYGLKRSGCSKREINRIALDYLSMVKMKGFEDYYPEQLSGGMQQRVALARALAIKPSMLLMDEPFAALDAQTRLVMQELLTEIRREVATTVVFVTHDVEEAVYLADKVYVMTKRPGRIIKEVMIPFAKPRQLSLRATPAFSQLKANILELIINQAN
jgi:ABC-type nitrate/sulfonate/bicarbonate transport system, ATPase component